MNSWPRILHIISELNRGGSELHLVKLLPYLQTSFDNQVACAIGRGPVGSLLAKQGIPVHYLNIKHHFNPLGLIKVRALIKRLSPQIVVTNLLYADVFSRITVTGLDLPLISNQRSSLPGRAYLRLADRLTRNAVTHFVVQTPHMSHAIQKTVGVAESRISVIPNIVEILPVTVPPLQIRHRLGLTPAQIVITCVSNLRPYKGHLTLLEAFRRVVYQLPTTNYQLLLIGSGPLQSHLAKQTANLGLTNSVRFLGARTDISNLLAMSDIFVLPSEAEGMSNALLEAMARGLPCIAADIPSNRFIITPHKTGLLFNVRDPDSLAVRIIRLAASGDLRYRLGQAARQHVQAAHNPNQIVKRWKELFEKILI